MAYYKKIGLLKDENGKVLATIDIVECLSKDEYLTLKKESEKSYNEIVEKDKLEKEELKKEIVNFKNEVNNILEKYHKILATLVKENE